MHPYAFFPAVLGVLLFGGFPLQSMVSGKLRKSGELLLQFAPAFREDHRKIQALPRHPAFCKHLFQLGPDIRRQITRAIRKLLLMPSFLGKGFLNIQA